MPVAEVFTLTDEPSDNGVEPILSASKYRFGEWLVPHSCLEGLSKWYSV
jgi:hypothetical protein